MRASQVVAPGKIVIHDIPVPQLAPGQVLVRTLLISLCGSDVHMLHTSAPDRYPFPIGTSGHEVIAVVEAVAAPDSGIKAGDVALVLRAHHTGMVEMFLAPPEDILLLPDHGSIEHLLMAQQLGTVIYACKRLPNLVGKDIVVIGQGSAGLFFDTMCRRLGAAQVIAMDIKEARVAAALKFGATQVFNDQQRDAVQTVREITHGAMADLVIEAVGEPETINLAMPLVKKHGSILFFGVPRAETFAFDFGDFFQKNCTAITSVGAGFEPGRLATRQALDLISRGEIDVSSLITHRLPFDQLRQAYDLATTRDDGAIKVIVEMPGYHKWETERRARS